MHLKRIEIAGFKSFPDPTEVIFGSGVTAVVGPNGCGKSNLTDAVRWVLGEQRARVLRGGKMDEVIFGGTPQRPPVSVCEVTLIIDNKSGVLPCDFEDVAVTRRLDRAGNSEYRLNRAPCRLKDINDLFMDTGMGSHSYSVIQQGMIDAIISENTDDVRYLFEEAAGVSKYKSRKRAAIRKLDATESDLTRLTDLKNEVATRTRSLARQKGKAERFREFQEELKELRRLEAGRVYRGLLTKRTSGDAKFREADDDYQGLQTQVDALEMEWQTLRMASEDAERLATEAADHLAEATGRWHNCQTRLVQLRDRKTYLENEQTSLSDRRVTLTNRRTDYTDRLKHAEATRESAHTERRTVEDSSRQAEQAYRTAKEMFDGKTESHRQLEDALQEARDHRARLDSEQAATTERQENWTRLIEELNARQARLEEDLRRAETEAERLKRERDDSTAALNEQRMKTGQATARLTELQQEQSQKQNDCQLWEERLREWQSAHSMLSTMITRGEGFGAAAESVLANSERWGNAVTGFGDRLRPRDGWDRAVEAVLADRLGALLCRDTETATSLVNFLSSESTGRAVVLDPSVPVTAPSDRPDIQVSGCAGWLDDHVECDDEVRQWTRALLGGTLVVENREQARGAFAQSNGQYGVVSRDGFYIEPSGVVRVGDDTSVEPIVGRRERLDEFERRIADGRTALADLQKRLEAIGTEIPTAQEAAEREQIALTDLERRLSEQRLSLEAANARAAEYRRSRDELATDIESRRTALADQTVQGENQLATGRSAQARIDELTAQLTQSRDELETLEEQLNAAGVALNDARVKGVEVVARYNAAEVECQRLAEAIREADVELDDIARKLETHAEELNTLAEQLQTTSEEHATLTDEKTRLDEQRANARSNASRQREVFSEMDVKVKDVRRRRDEAERKRSQIEVDRSRLDAELDQYRRYIQESLSLDPAELPEDESPLSDEDLKIKVVEVSNKIDSIGPVNPLALEEYEHEKERWDFFEKQLSDLRTAKKELNETITELNRTAGQRFVETFETARAHFQEVFTELFRGGEADVRLVNVEDPLESPIEIYARPRGKKFIGLRQLSGGERALTALALLFGLYLVKPSPFCILDEVDAPLDDANCGRFLRLIDRFKTKTQFIIVTHNKLTMEAADGLYGVTMEQSGISRIVSVRLNRAGEDDQGPGLAEPRIELDANGTVVSITESNEE